MCPDNIEALAGVYAEKTDIRAAKAVNGLSLAFIGDAVYELLVRNYVLTAAQSRVQDLHASSVKMANASFQAAAISRLRPLLTADEEAIYKRGRNAHSAHTPKNKSEAEYHKATGFEAVFGYLFLTRQYERINDLFAIVSEKSFIAEEDA